MTETIGGWNLVFYIGNFLADFAIVIFTIKIGYIDKKLEILRGIRKSILLLYNSILNADQKIKYDGDLDETNKRERIKELINPTFISVFDDIREYLKDTVPGTVDEYTLYSKKYEIGIKLNEINREYLEEKKRYYHKYLDFELIIYVFIIGVLFQIASLSASIGDLSIDNLFQISSPTTHVSLIIIAFSIYLFIILLLLHVFSKLVDC